MKGTCVQCHKLTCNSSGLPAKLLMAQLRAVELGLFSIAQELGGFIKDHFSAENGPKALHGSSQIFLIIILNGFSEIEL